LNRRLGLWEIPVLDRVDPKTEEAGKSFDGGEKADVGLHKRNITRKIENGVAREVVRLEFLEI
jgi:hypothetical protein